MAIRVGRSRALADPEYLVEPEEFWRIAVQSGDYRRTRRRSSKTGKVLADRRRLGGLSADSARISRAGRNLGGSSASPGSPPSSAGIPGPVGNLRQRSRIIGVLRESMSSGGIVGFGRESSALNGIRRLRLRPDTSGGNLRPSGEFSAFAGIGGGGVSGRGLGWGCRRSRRRAGIFGFGQESSALSRSRRSPAGNDVSGHGALALGGIPAKVDG